MTNALTILRRIALPIAAVALVAVLEPLLLQDSRLLLATSIIALATLPSILAYALCEHFAPARTWLRHALFLTPVILIAAVCLGLAAQEGPSAHLDLSDIYRWILLGYLLQIAPAYLVFILSSPRQN
jgi:hypothetical protein